VRAPHSCQQRQIGRELPKYGTDHEEDSMNATLTLAEGPEPATMSIPTAARLLGISRSAGYRAAACGQIPTIRIGRRLLVPTARLHQLLGITDHDSPAVGVAEGETVEEGAR
jgi:excisionase family DNA binding protein